MAVRITMSQVQPPRGRLAKSFFWLAAPTGVPPDRVMILRRAFDLALKDPGFLDEADKACFDIDPMTGEEVEDAINQVLDTPKDIVAESKAAIEAPTR